MTTTAQPQYGTETALTWSGAIASSPTAGRQSNTIDNTSTLADDYIVAISYTFPNSAPANDKTVYLYGGGWGGATAGWQGRPALSGSDAAYTASDITTTPTGLFQVSSSFAVQNVVGSLVVPSLATLFGGSLPPKVAFLLINYSGQTLSAFSATYTAVKWQLV